MLQKFLPKALKWAGGAEVTAVRGERTADGLLKIIQSKTENILHAWKGLGWWRTQDVPNVKGKPSTIQLLKVKGEKSKIHSSLL